MAFNLDSIFNFFSGAPSPMEKNDAVKLELDSVFGDLEKRAEQNRLMAVDKQLRDAFSPVDRMNEASNELSSFFNGVQAEAQNRKLEGILDDNKIGMEHMAMGFVPSPGQIAATGATVLGTGAAAFLGPGILERTLGQQTDQTPVALPTDNTPFGINPEQQPITKEEDSALKLGRGDAMKQAANMVGTTPDDPEVLNKVFQAFDPIARDADGVGLKDEIAQQLGLDPTSITSDSLRMAAQLTNQQVGDALGARDRGIQVRGEISERRRQLLQKLEQLEAKGNGEGSAAQIISTALPMIAGIVTGKTQQGMAIAQNINKGFQAEDAKRQQEIVGLEQRALDMGIKMTQLDKAILQNTGIALDDVRKLAVTSQNIEKGQLDILIKGKEFQDKRMEKALSPIARGKLTQDQRADAAFAYSLESSEARLSALEDKMTEAGMWNKLSFFADSLSVERDVPFSELVDRFQAKFSRDPLVAEYVTQVRAMADDILRAKSGAQTAETEAGRLLRTYFSFGGDPEGSRQVRANSRRGIIDMAKTRAGAEAMTFIKEGKAFLRLEPMIEKIRQSEGVIDVVPQDGFIFIQMKDGRKVRASMLELEKLLNNGN